MSKTGRNDPCPCGSGRKYKLCCGALRLTPAPTLPLAAARTAGGAREDGAQAPSRPCGTCTRCCDGWLEGEIRGHPMFPGQRCHFAGNGACTIYDERPQSPCRSFVCGWAEPSSPLPDDWRPDQVGVIVVTTRWRNAPALILVSAGNDPDEAMLGRLREHASRTGTPFFYAQNGERFGYGPPAFQYEMAAKVARGDKLW